MSDNVINPPSNVLELPAFGKAPALKIDMNNIREAEKRFIEAKTVNPSTYVDLEHTFNESYRDVKRHLSNIGYQINLADKAMRDAKAEVLLGSYADFMKGKPKSHDNADLRDAFLIKDPSYVAALDRFHQLKALESNFEGKLKVLENVCRYMRQKMYLISKSGLGNENLYVTGGKK
jgi:hypothetical protein